MPDALTSRTMSPELLKVAERAKREPDAQFHSLAHLIDEGALARAYRRLRPSAAVGVDGTSKEEYGRDLEERLRDLHERLRSKRYRHQPIRRVYIPKDRDQVRPIGIAALEDKIVQGAPCEVLEAVYEQDFLDCSYSCRPGRSAHDALRALHRAVDRGKGNWILESDVASFFDHVNRKRVSELLQQRVPDGSIRRLVGKCLHVGVWDGSEYTEPDRGTVQGSALSPLLGNLYLHHALDLWFEAEVTPRLRGEALLVRFVEDFVIAFELQEDAERVREVLPKRMARFDLTLHSKKTRLLPFGRPSGKRSEPKPSSFDFWALRCTGGEVVEVYGGWRARPSVEGSHGPFIP
jgi:RNA-directed DNA polymerase